MPRFSIIVPTHDVSGRLSDCLESVLAQSGDLELITVLPAAPGPAAPIVARRAERDARVRSVCTDPANGLGAARNAGVAAARGDYLLFLDGDDTFTPDAVRRIDERLNATHDPDLLLFDHERIHWFDGGQGSALERVWAAAPVGAFSLKQHTALPDPLLPAWSAAYRRQFATRHTLTFAPGMFTDLSWCLPAALHARDLAVLDEICVQHHLRRQGRRPRLPGPHHMDFLDQLDLVMCQANELDLPTGVRERLFLRLFHEVLKTSADPDRLGSSSLQRQFFKRASHLYQLHRPAGLPVPSGSLGVQHRLLAAGAHTASRTLRSLRRSSSRITLPVPRRARRDADPRTTLYSTFLEEPVDENLAVYSAYWGRGYTCNPAAIHTAARRLAPHIKSVFLVTEDTQEHVPDDVERVVIGSAAYWEVMARAKYTFNNVNFEQVMRKRPGTFHVQTQHGTPLKRMGLETFEYPAACSSIGNHQHLLQRIARWDFNLSSNRHSTEIWERAYPGDYETLDYGYPRNDVFYNTRLAGVRELRRRLGIPENRIAVLYAPTYRDYASGFDARLDLTSFCEALGDEFVVVLRAHHSDEGSPRHHQALDPGKLIDLTEHRSPEEVCLASDVLISDYSSITFDYANLDRPMVTFVPDWEVYRDTRGVYFDLLAAPPGPVARTPQQLTQIFRTGEWNGDRARALRSAFRSRFCDFDDGRAAERVVRRVLLQQAAEDIPPIIPLARRTPAPAAGLAHARIREVSSP